MHRIREILRLKYDCCLSIRKIARACGIDRETVAVYLNRAEKAGLSWSLAQGLSETEVEARLFPTPTHQPGAERPLPDCQYIYDELRSYKKLNLTIMQLWIEYKEQHPDGLQYTQFCEHYRRWRGKLDYCMRQEHRAGEKLFIDYADGLCLTDPKTGERIETQLFVAVWGASNYTYAEASLTQSLPHWSASHVRAFEYFGCCPAVLTPDNLKSGVHEPCFYDPEINRSYAELAAHYGCAVLPAKPYRARYKAKVENGVLISKRWILAVLRHRTFFSLNEHNAAIRELLERLNTRPLRKLKQSRRELFDSIDRPAARPLPERAYEYAEWRKARVHIDYHVEVDRHYYSVPHRLLREEVHIRLTTNTVEAFHKGERVAGHARSYVPGKHTTNPDHMPPAHRKYAQWTPARMIEWAGKTGPATATAVEKIMASRPHPEQGYRACLGVLKGMVECYGHARVEAACRRAVEFNTCSYRSLRSILQRGLDKQVQPKPAQPALPFHENIRGGQYYH